MSVLCMKTEPFYADYILIHPLLCLTERGEKTRIKGGDAMKKGFAAALAAAIIIIAVQIMLNINPNMIKVSPGSEKEPVTTLASETTTVTTVTTTSTTVTTTTVTTTTTTAALQFETSATDVYCKDRFTLSFLNGTAKSWSSSDPKTVSVDKKGKLTAEKAGEAIITAKDADGNTAQCKVRSIKVVYLTIDDWPNENTAKILDILKENDVKATFFLAGTTKYQDMYKRIAQEGHSMGNHTYSHNMPAIYESFDRLYKEITKQQKFVTSFSGNEELKIFRFPGGSNENGKGFAKTVRKKNYHVFDWSATLGDTSSKATAEKCLNNAKKFCKDDREILLMHHKAHSAEALPAIIEYLKGEGYTFAPITMDTTPYAFA